MKQHIHESNLIEDVDNHHADNIGMIAFEMLLEESRITENSIWRTQRIITVLQSRLEIANRHRGEYRDLHITVGGRPGADPFLIQGLVRNWIVDMRNYRAIDPKYMHIRFEKIHPFADGNGRTGRLLMWWHEKKLGKEPTLILNSEKQAYYKWFG